MTVDSDEDLIRAHYEDFNQRRVDAAAARFRPEATLEHVTGRIEQGPGGYRQFAERWLAAFPDGRVTVQSIHPRGPGTYEANLLLAGTHLGTLAFGPWVFHPTGSDVQLGARELFQVKDRQFSFAHLSLDLQDMVRQLTSVDTSKLIQHLARIQQLAESLTAAGRDPRKQREVIDRIGTELDAARHVVRPYFR